MKQYQELVENTVQKNVEKSHLKDVFKIEFPDQEKSHSRTKKYLSVLSVERNIMMDTKIIKTL